MTPTLVPPEDENIDRDDIDRDDIDGFDDFPETHLEDEDYEAFLAKEFDDDQRLRSEPRVVWAIGLAIVLLAVLLVFLSL